MTLIRSASERRDRDNDDAFDAAALCAIEQIQFLGEIQPHGFLIELSSDWMVRRVSANSAEMLGREPDALIGLSAVEVLGGEVLHDVRSQLQVTSGGQGGGILAGARLPAREDRFDITVHRAGEGVVIEGERWTEPAAHSADVQTMLLQLQQVGDVSALSRLAVRQVRALTGYDRVMFYRFHADDSGEVVAEARRGGLEPYQGLRYPATDIPPQARALYLRNPIRSIADVHAQTVPIVPRLGLQGERIDLSMAELRAVSPTHIQYLKNMGVAASMSLSIVVDGKLWGLLACHHNSPRVLAPRARQSIAFYARILSGSVESLVRREAVERQAMARSLHNRMMSQVSSARGQIDDLFPYLQEMLGQLDADGMATYVDGRLRIEGLTPSEVETIDLMRFLNGAAASKVYATNALSAVYPKDWTQQGIAGLLAIPVSRRPRDYVVFFRREIVSKVRWAGDPTKVAVQQGDGSLRLSPRSSFEEWQETVRHQSAHWRPADLELAEALRISLIEIMLQFTDQAEKQRKATNDQQDLLISELNHRVRNILGLIVGLVRQCADGAETVGQFSEEVNRRVHALARAHDQLTSGGWGARSVVQMIRVEAGAYLGDKADRVVVTGEEAAIQADAFATVALLVHELITNAAKYGALKDSNGRVLIHLDCDEENGLAMIWEEEGGGKISPPTRRGFGSTIIERAIPHELGGTATIEFREDGLWARFTIPSSYIASCTQTQEPQPVDPRAPTHDNERLDGEMLLVEDNLLIALEVESMLRSLGAGDVHVASNVAGALDYLKTSRPAFALLDYNLGREQSIPVAERLQELGIPFVFATGYGDTSIIDQRFRNRPILTKPYTASNVLGSYAAVGRS